MRPVDSLQSGESIGAQFMRLSSLPIAVFTSLVSYILSLIWFFRAGANLLHAVGLTGLYLLVTVLGVQLYHPVFRLYEDDGRRVMEYTRPGCSWPVLLEGLIGCAIVFALAYFVIFNSLPFHPEVAAIIANTAVIVDFLLVPLIPVLAGSPQIPLFKSSVNVLLTPQDEVSEVLDVKVGLLDISWYQLRQSEELRVSLLERFGEMTAVCAIPHS